ncbi:hypothetical protein V8C40DRAFT_247146 [Trichoderma camerunense]
MRWNGNPHQRMWFFFLFCTFVLSQRGTVTLMVKGASSNTPQKNSTLYRRFKYTRFQQLHR